MSHEYRWHRAVDLLGALRQQKEQAARDRWSRDRLLAFQHERVAALVAHATRHSPLYRQRYGGELAPADVELSQLPVLDKATMMHGFDDLVTDPRLRRADLEQHLAGLEGDELYLGEYRVMASGGSSGQRGIYVYDRRAWRTLVGSALRWTGMIGFTPRLPRRRGFAIGAPDAKHMTFRLAATLDVGLHRMQRAPATEPLDRLVARLEAHRPEFMNVYPSIAALLAREQCAGRLDIQPSIVCTSSELRTPEMTELIRAAWGVEPFNCLGLTETGITAVDCIERRGMHVFEDLCVYEVVNHSGAPVPPGEPGARVLVTNLFNYTQPLIRFEITDLATLDDGDCPCGRPSRRIVALDGRSDDILELPTATGGTTAVHPLALRGPMAALASITQYQIIAHRDRLEIAVVLQPGAAAADARQAVRDALGARLAELGVVATVDVAVRDRLLREGAGKLKLVKRAW